MFIVKLSKRMYIYNYMLRFCSQNIFLIFLYILRHSLMSFFVKGWKKKYCWLMQIDFALEIVFLLIWSVKFRYFKPTIKINLLELHYTYFFLSADSFKPKYLAVLWIVNIKSLRVQKVGKIFWYIYYAKKLSRYFQNQWTGDLEFTNRFFF